jgi:hypothetical protein
MSVEIRSKSLKTNSSTLEKPIPNLFKTDFQFIENQLSDSLKTNYRIQLKNQTNPLKTNSEPIDKPIPNSLKSSEKSIAKSRSTY